MNTPKFWIKKNIFTYLLLPLSALYYLLSKIDRNRKLKHAKKLPVPVIVIGNITAGGTGKTPVTIALVKALMDEGYTIGVLSRGYGRQNSDCIVATPQHTSQDLGDEPYLIYQKTAAPLAVCAQRYNAGVALLKAVPDIDILICDDGLQHYALKRDIEIAVVGKQGFGNHCLIPAGPLRERIERLNTVDYIIANDSSQLLKQLHYPYISIRNDLTHAYLLSHPETKQPLNMFRGKKISVVAGIAYPELFFDQLYALDIKITPFAFPDHHNFSAEDFKNIPFPIMMTEKDAVKCTWLKAYDNVWVVPLITTLPHTFILELIKHIKNNL